jgi:hypothetical protein
VRGGFRANRASSFSVHVASFLTSSSFSLLPPSPFLLPSPFRSDAIARYGSRILGYLLRALRAYLARMQSRTAFTLTEVLVALILVTIAVLGSATAIRAAARVQMHAAALRTVANELEARVAQLSATPCDAIATNTVASNGATIRWTAVPTSAAVRLEIRGELRDASASRSLEVACE